MIDKSILKQLLIGTVTLGVFYYFLKAAFDGFVKNMRPEFKEKIGTVISNASLAELTSVLRVFILNLINVIFGERHLTKISFVRSFIASGIFVLLLHVILFAKRPELFVDRTPADWLTFFTSFIINWVVYNTLDFFLLLKTRMLLKWLASKNDKYDTHILLLDIITSFVFGFFKYCAVVMLLSFELPNVKYFFTEVVTIKIPEEFKPPEYYGVVHGLFFYATFLYSIFMVLYYISIYLVKTARVADFFKKGLEKFVDVKKDPIEFLNIIFNLIASLIVAIIMFIRLPYK